MTGHDIITGGAGFIGSHLVEALIKAGRDVVVIDNFSTGRLANLDFLGVPKTLKIVEADINDTAKIESYFKNAERVFHIAALADLVPSVQNPAPYYYANVNGTFNILQLARAAKIRKMIYVASSTCYGIPDKYPTIETAPTDPRYPYALTKYLGEQLAMHWARVYDLPCTSLRFFNVYGPRSRTSGIYGAVFGVFLAQILNNQPLTIVGDGNQTRDFTYVTDVVDSILFAADHGKSGEVYNVGSGNPVSVNKIVELLSAKSTVHMPKRPGEPDCTHADITKIQALGWRPKVPIEKGVQNMLAQIDYWREAPVWTPDSIANATADWFKYVK